MSLFLFPPFIQEGALGQRSGGVLISCLSALPAMLPQLT